MTTTDDDRHYRIEHDSMGEVKVPADAKGRAQTQRAVENFPVSGQRLERAHIEAPARIKGAAAKENARLGVLDEDIAHLRFVRATFYTRFSKLDTAEKS